MEIYVQSCGISQEHDYRWLKIPEAGEQNPEIPGILRRAIRTETDPIIRLTDLYDCQEPTIVVAQDDGELLLLVTALESVKRTKIYGRQVRNSVAWVIQDNEENKQLLNRIAAYVRENWDEMRKAIDEAVEFDDKKGFSVNRALIENFYKYVEYVVNGKNGENVKQQGELLKKSSPSSKISVVHWDMEKRKKRSKLPIFLFLFFMIFPFLVIVGISKILSGTNIEESPPSPTPVTFPPHQK